MALSQNNVNSSLKNLFNMTPELQKLSLNLGPNFGNETMTGSLDPPLVNFNVVGNVFAIYFMLNISSGTFTYWDGFGPNAQQKTMTMNKWTIAFTVNLSLEQLNNVPPDISKKIQVPGSYSVRQLLLDFTTANVTQFNQTLTKIPGLNQQTDTAAFTTLQNFIQVYVNQQSVKGNSILGYAVTVDNPTGDTAAVTFPPTSVLYQTMPYHTNGNPDEPVTPADQGRSAIIFLEMTGHQPFPQNPLTWTGNWLVGDMAGAMAICKSNFWDAYFIKAIQNSTTIAHFADVVNMASYWITGDDFGSQTEWKLTSPDVKDQTLSSVKWNQTDSTNYAAPFSGKYNWSRHQFGGMQYDYYLESSITCYVGWAPGSSSIILRPTATLSIGETTTSPHGGMAVFHNTLNINIVYNLTLQSVDDGTLEIVVAQDTTKQSVTCTAYQSGMAGWFSKDGKLYENEAYTKSVADSVNSKLQNLSDVTTSIKDALNQQKNFVFPGSGTFLYKHAAFNAEGDLLVELNYNQ